MNEPLVLLILVWAALLVPGAVRARSTSPHVTVGGFEQAMRVLRSETHTGGGGRQVMVPDDAGRIVARPVDEQGHARRSAVEDPMMVRRRQWFVRSLLATVASFGLALLLGGRLWLLFLAVVAVTATYVLVLRRLKLQQEEARQVVRQLDLDVPSPVTSGQVAVGGEEGWVGSGTVRLRRWDG